MSMIECPHCGDCFDATNTEAELEIGIDDECEIATTCTNGECNKDFNIVISCVATYYYDLGE